MIANTMQAVDSPKSEWQPLRYMSIAINNITLKKIRLLN